MARSIKMKLVASAVDLSPTTRGTKPHGTADIQLRVQYPKTLTKADEALKATVPYGLLNFGVNDPAMAGFFERGKRYQAVITELAEGS